MASRRLNGPTGTTGIPYGTAAALATVTSTRPAGPAGHKPPRSAASVRSSSITSHERLVSASQPRNCAATDSQLVSCDLPVAAAMAAAYPDSTEARLVASIQTSISSRPDRHSDSAKAAASWVLPDEPSQSRASPAAG